MTKKKLKIIYRGLWLAESGRRDYEETQKYFDKIEDMGIAGKLVTLMDSEDGSVYQVTYSGLPYLGNKSARLASVYP